MRTIGKNVLEIADPYSDSSVKVFYTIPTTVMRLRFASLVNEEVDGEKRTLLEVFVEIGRTVISGYENGSFGIDDDNEKTIIVDSDSSSENYRPDWMVIIFPENGQNDDLLGQLGKWISDCLGHGGLRFIPPTPSGTKKNSPASKKTTKKSRRHEKTESAPPISQKNATKNMESGQPTIAPNVNEQVRE